MLPGQKWSEGDWYKKFCADMATNDPRTYVLQPKMRPAIDNPNPLGDGGHLGGGQMLFELGEYCPPDEAKARFKLIVKAALQLIPDPETKAKFFRGLAGYLHDSEFGDTIQWKSKEQNGFTTLDPHTLHAVKSACGVANLKDLLPEGYYGGADTALMNPDDPADDPMGGAGADAAFADLSGVTTCRAYRLTNAALNSG